MTRNAGECAHDHHGERWEHIAMAAEHFARRMARDAGRFAERLEGNATHFAREVSREWHRAARRHHQHRHHRACAAGEADVRRTFEDVRGILTDVLDGVDELIEKLFHDPDDGNGREDTPPASGDAAPEWQRIIANREMSCGTCDRVVEAGEEVEVRGQNGERQVRCAQCRSAGQTPDV